MPRRYSQSFDVDGDMECQRNDKPTSGGGLESYRVLLSFSFPNYVPLGQWPGVKYLAL
jgi:hypothetical protein